MVMWLSNSALSDADRQVDKKGQKKKEHKYNLAKDRCVTFIYQTFWGEKGWTEYSLTHSLIHLLN